MLDLRARRQLSQNFLLEPRAKPLAGCHVLEIGCGPGGFTRELFREGAQRVVGVELDRRFQPCLENLQDCVRAADRDLELHFTSAVNFSTDGLFTQREQDLSADWHSQQLPKIRLVGNLPFNISTPAAHDLAAGHRRAGRSVWQHGRVPLVLTFQKEFADRLLADTWTRSRAAGPSILTQYLCEARRCFDISGRSGFLPQAKVDVTVPADPDAYPYVNKLVKHAFAFPNKSLVACMETLFPPDRCDLLIRLFAETGTQPQCTPRELSIAQFSDLCQAYHRMCQTEGSELFDFTYIGKEDLWRTRKSVQRKVLNGLTVNYFTVANIVNKTRLAQQANHHGHQLPAVEHGLCAEPDPQADAQCGQVRPDQHVENVAPTGAHNQTGLWAEEPQAVPRSALTAVVIKAYGPFTTKPPVMNRSTASV
uniref:rRNA adenine N(6)-methyltransferase n=1 Tax=Macrostomum lignano TaxID=282301 RepID=A0A1I8F661_9PLAT